MSGLLETNEAKADRAARIIELLRPVYPDTRPLLDFKNPFQLLVATVLSAQCTDAMVNRVTPELFARYPRPALLAAAELPALENVVRRTGFYRSKARHLVELATTLIEKHGGEVPKDLNDLVALSGVGRKTAGVILSVCFGKAAIIVDTHFARVTRRLGLAEARDPGALEAEIAAFLPQDHWSDFSHLINRHGRLYCVARKPRCADCPIRQLCQGAESQNNS